MGNKITFPAARKVVFPLVAVDLSHATRRGITRPKCNLNSGPLPAHSGSGLGVCTLGPERLPVSLWQPFRAYMQAIKRNYI